MSTSSRRLGSHTIFIGEIMDAKADPSMLGLGLSVFIMFVLLADFISNFDSCLKNADRIYAFVKVTANTQVEEQHSTILPAP